MGGMAFEPDEAPEDRMSGPYPVRARGQRHRDAPLSDREQRVWWAIWGVLGALVVASIVFWLTH